MSTLPAATVLARKYRPRRFSEVQGQDPVVHALQHGILSGRLHHAYLLTGSRGVGKTTLARILAKALNCEHREAAEPCNACSSCQSIDRGRHVDVLELDAASHRGVGDIQEVLEQTRFAPTNGRYKVLVIDEVHMLSGHAFNAMLKTLEEPPPSVLFVMATTDPQKIPVTILSRCLEFSLRNLPVEKLQSHLSWVLSQEQVEAEDAAVLAIARAGRGSVRDALSLTDQAIAVGGGAVREALVSSMLGLVSLEKTQQLVDHLLGGEVAESLGAMDSLMESGAAPESVLEALAAELHDRTLALALSEGGLAAQADLAESLQLAYQIALAGRRDLGLAPDETLGLRMTMLRILAFRPTAAPLQSASLPAATEQRPAAPPAAPRSARAQPLRPPLAEQAIPATPPAEIRKTAPPEWPSLTPDDWTSLMERLSVQGLVKQLALHSALLQWPAQPRDAISIQVARPALAQQESVERLAAKVSEALGHVVRIEVQAGRVEAPAEVTSGIAPQTAASKAAAAADERQRAAEQAIDRSEVVQVLRQQFDARLIQGSVSPCADEPPWSTS